MKPTLQSSGSSHISLRILAPFVGILLSTVWLSAGIAVAQERQQTRDQCNACCQRAGYDEYYAEQCRLKCFRNPDHCMNRASNQLPPPAGRADQEADRPEPPAGAAPPPAPPQTRRQAEPPAQRYERPPADPGPLPQNQMPYQPGPPPQQAGPPPRAAGFQWPNPLNLSPGREADAAGQILVLNGIPPQHPNFDPALRNIQGLLMDFVRNNPSGGKLPTTQLERIIRQFR